MANEILDIRSGLLTTLVFLVLLYLTLLIGGSYFFLGIVIVSGAILGYLSYRSVILLTLLLVCLYLLNKRYGSNTCENFYTLFTPATQNVQIPNIPLNFQEKVHWQARRKPLYIMADQRKKALLQRLSEILLSRARILNIRLSLEPVSKILTDSQERKVDVIALPSPVVKNNRDLVFLGNIQKEYLFCVSSVEKNIQNMSFVRGKKVGVVNHMLDVWKDIHVMVSPGDVIIENENTLLHLLRAGDIDVIFYTGIYPSTFLDKVMKSTLQHRYQLIPCIFKDERYFLPRNPQYRKTSVTLLHPYLTARYLPTVIGRNVFNNYTDDYWTLSYDISLLATKNLDKFTGYEIAKTIFYGRDNLDPGISILDIIRPNLPEMPIAEGAKAFYLDKGLLSHCGNKKCLLFIGRKKCTC